MRTTIPINTTPDGCAYAIVTRYEARAHLKGMTSGGVTFPAPQSLKSWKMRTINLLRIGNLYGRQFGPSFAGNVYNENGLSPALMTMSGGAGNR